MPVAFLPHFAEQLGIESEALEFISRNWTVSLTHGWLGIDQKVKCVSAPGYVLPTITIVYGRFRASFEAYVLMSFLQGSVIMQTRMVKKKS